MSEDHYKPMTPEEHAAHTRSFYHDSRALIEDELRHLSNEIHRICKTHKIPYSLVFEEQLNVKGSQVNANFWFDENRAETSGLPGRFMLLMLAGRAGGKEMAAICKLLGESGWITPETLKL